MLGIKANSLSCKPVAKGHHHAHGLLAGRASIMAARLRWATVANAFLLRPTGDGSTDHIDGEPRELAGPFLLGQGQFEVGRDGGSSISIPIPTVSTRHALLLVGPYSDAVEGEMLLLTDLRSTNGTMVNGSEVEPLSVVELRPGAEVVFGDSHLARFKVERSDGSNEPAAVRCQPVTDNE